MKIWQEKKQWRVLIRRTCEISRQNWKDRKPADEDSRSDDRHNFCRRILFIAGLAIILEITPCVYLVHTVTVNVPS